MLNARDVAIPLPLWGIVIRDLRTITNGRAISAVYFVANTRDLFCVGHGYDAAGAVVVWVAHTGSAPVLTAVCAA